MIVQCLNIGGKMRSVGCLIIKVIIVVGDLVIRSFLRLKQNYQHYTIRKHTIQTTTKNNGSFYLSNQQVSVETKPATYEEMTKLTKTLYPGIRTYMAVYLFLQPVVVQLLLVSNGRRLKLALLHLHEH